MRIRDGTRARSPADGQGSANVPRTGAPCRTRCAPLSSLLPTVRAGMRDPLPAVVHWTDCSAQVGLNVAYRVVQM